MAGSCNEGRDWGFGIWDRQTRSAGDPASPCLDASGMSEKTTASGGVLAKVAAYPAVALVLQGGGAPGAYQCGVYQGLHEAGIRPNWLAGISIGSRTASLIAGNVPENRVARLQAFWDEIREPAQHLDQPAPAVPPAAAIQLGRAS